MKIPAFALAAALSFAAPAEAAQRKLPPVDQCKDAGLAVFRQQLVRAVTRRDREALLRLLAPDVLVNFGGDKGRVAFARQWELERPARSGLWRELETVLGLGCARVGKARVMPSLAGQFSPEADQDMFEKMIVTSAAARLRKSRSKDSGTARVLGWDVVTVLEAPGDGEQIKVRLADGREGWLSRTQLRSPLDYRLVAEKRQGKWMITAFVAGD